MNDWKGGMAMFRRGRFVALALCACMLLTMLISSAYIAHETAHPHACCGEDCPICQFIEQVEASLKGFSLILLALFALAIATVARQRRVCFEDDAPAVLPTLVAEKIRLND